jgi:hypothetical protein
MTSIGRLGLAGILLFAPMVTWASRIDNGPSGGGQFSPNNSLSGCTAPSAATPFFNVNGAPCIVILADPSSNLDGFNAFQVGVGGTITTPLPPIPGELVYEIPNFANDNSVTFSFGFDPTDPNGPGFGSFEAKTAFPANPASTSYNFMVNDGGCMPPQMLPGSSGPNNTFTFNFLPTTSTCNPQNTTNWFFYADGPVNGISVSSSVSSPEPDELVLLLSGLTGIGLMIRSRRPARV